MSNCKIEFKHVCTEGEDDGLDVIVSAIRTTDDIFLSVQDLHGVNIQLLDKDWDSVVDHARHVFADIPFPDPKNEGKADRWADEF